MILKTNADVSTTGFECILKDFFLLKFKGGKEEAGVKIMYEKNVVALYKLTLNEWKYCQYKNNNRLNGKKIYSK